MDFISNQKDQFEAMLAALGLQKIDQLFGDIPTTLKMDPPQVDDGLSEYEGLRLIESIANRNSFAQMENYLGGGAYEHHVPALVSAICSKSEYLTAYTPYQAEASQGLLQTTFEFQSAICALTGLDVSNASLYDGASACAEALLMALRIHKDRKKVLVARSLHPHYRQVIEEYLGPHLTEIEFIPFKANGTLDTTTLTTLLREKPAAILLQYPNFFGVIDDLKAIFQEAKQQEVLSIVCANPLVYGLFQSAAELGADIAIGDCQPFGLPLQFGGPYVGYMACRESLVRQMPGRIVGETIDSTGARGFVLTLQAREQNIRREKATSNICTNQALAALASLVAILWYGKEGVRKLALTNYQRAAYLRDKLVKVPGMKIMTQAPCFNEFVVKFNEPLVDVHARFRQAGIEPGLDLGRYFPELSQHLLIAVTETKSQEQLDRYVEIAGGRDDVPAT